MVSRRSFARLRVVAGLVFVSATAASAEWDVDGLEELLPRAETPRERADREARLARGPLDARLAADPPPLAPVRNCAEWEPCTGVLVRYPLGLPYVLLRDFDDQVTLHVIVSSGMLAAAQANLAANGVDMGRVEFLVKPNDSIWTRDYGPWYAFDGTGQLVIVDHVYNRPSRPNDDLIPVHFAQQQGIPFVRHDMWHSGGNYMTDGARFSASTDLVYDEAAAANGMTPAEVDALMFDYYGIVDYNVMADIEAGGIHHIDTWGKFLDEETVLVKSVWPAHPTFDDLEQRATLLASLEASTGRPYRVFRVACHDIGGGRPASYTNSLVLNQTIYVPTFSSAGNDAAALDAYEEAAPGYTVRGYDYSGWLTDDALHCRAKGVKDRGMLRVAHVPVREEQFGDVTLQATVHSHSGSAVTVVDVWFRRDGGAWSAMPMTPNGPDTYEAMLPAPTSPAATDYYIHAEDASGRSEGVPRTEPAAFFSFDHLPAGVGVETVPVVRSDAAHPNPFRASTRFTFRLHHEGHVALDVVDARGRLVQRVADGIFSGGETRLEWDGRDEGGFRVAPGVYYFRLRAAGLSYTRPVTKLE